MVATTTRRLGGGNKYGAKRTWSASCDRWFDSKAEAARAEELVLLERAGEIKGLEFQPSWVLSDRPSVTYTADFRYRDPSRMVNFADGPRMTQEPLVVVEDVKGVLTRDVRTKLAWLRAQHGVTVTLLRQTRGGFEEVAWLGRERKTKQRRKT